MRKEFQLGEYFPTGEPTIQLVMSTNSVGKRLFEKQAFDRAAASPAIEYLSSVMPEAGCSILLLNAMGAFETYDDNRNGDAFPNRPVGVGRKATCGHPGCQQPAWVGPDQVLSKHHESFLKAHFFEHHKNKDPKKAFGHVLKSFWNDRMQRVELLVKLIEAKNQKLADRIHAGEYPAVSMGCRVKYDVCNICGHRAPTRSDYCSHARDMLRQVLSDGTKVCVHNPDPDFFDISSVWRPADPQGFMLKKVADHALWEGWSAEKGEELDAAEHKIAEAKKFSEIRKAILGQITKVKSDSEKAISAFVPVAKAEALAKAPKSEQQIDQLAKLPISKVASFYAANNQTLTTSDVVRIFFKKAGLVPSSLDMDVIVALQPAIDGLYELDPGLRDKVGELIHVDDDAKYAGMYSVLMSMSSPTGIGAAYQAGAAPKTDILTLTDPNTGHQYQTTRGAAQAASWSNKRHALIGSLLLSSAYGLGLNSIGVTKRLPWWVKAPVAAAAGVGTYRAGQQIARPFRNPEYITDQGIAVPGNTEFQKASSVGGLQATSVLTKIAADYYERTGDCVNPVASLNAKIAAAAPNRKIAVFLSLAPETQTDVLYKASQIVNAEGDSEVDVHRLEQALYPILNF